MIYSFLLCVLGCRLSSKKLIQYLSFKSVQSFWVGDVSLELPLENAYKTAAINSLVATLTQEPPDVSTIIYFIKLMK